jgi:predicted AAA+ superfamily ATPase
MKRKMMGSLVEWKGEKDRKPLILRGVRQCGKTFLLKEFGRSHFPKYHHVNFEKQANLAKIFEPNLDPLRIIDELSIALNTDIDIDKDLVIFDEIQALPTALTSLKYFAEECPQLHLCAAGSLLGIHLNSGSFPVGKVTFRTLHPMSFEEFLWAAGEKKAAEILTAGPNIPEIAHERLWDKLKRYFVVGGLPEVVGIYCNSETSLFETLAKVREKQDDLLNTYYADISKHSGKVNAMHIDRVFRSVPMQLSRSQDSSTARFRFRGVVPGISHYDRLTGPIDWLENAGLIVKIHITNTAALPFMAHSKENIFKLFLFDVGMLGCMSGLSPKAILDYEYGTYKGYFAENFVAQELLASGFSQLFSWEEGKSQLEFLSDFDGKIIPIEVKSGNIVKAKSLAHFQEKYAPPFSIILSGQPLRIDSKQIHRYPLYLAGQLRDRLRQ